MTATFGTAFIATGASPGDLPERKGLMASPLPNRTPYDYGVWAWAQKQGVYGRCGITPTSFDTSQMASGVLGESTKGLGVLGYSEASAAAGGIGVFGLCSAGYGVAGLSNKSAGVFGWSDQGYAGLFQGNVKVTGTLTIGVKNGVVAFPDGSHRLLHCMESPQHWFEDFGAARLKGGRATVMIDADFSKVIRTGDYHVFLTPRGDCRGLCVRRQGGASFEVRELQGGTSSVAFSYRIVGKRKDIKAHKRFAKVEATLPMLAKPARGRARAAAKPSSMDVLLAALRKQAGGKPARARKGRAARRRARTRSRGAM